MAIKDGGLFTPLKLQNITLKNRVLRSATYEGLGDPSGCPRTELANVYRNLAQGGVGAIITGFVYTSQAGRAMHPSQCGIDDDKKTEEWKTIIEQVKNDFPDIRFFMQLAHTGRQTRSEVTGQPAVGVSSKKCTYFRQPVTVLSCNEIETIIREFGQAARRAKAAGFDGVQLHAAHGYLIHQFLSPWTNTRRDRWGHPHLFLEETIRAVKSSCGQNFPLLLKLSAADDNTPGIRLSDTIETIQRMESFHIDAVEISYGTMEYALNIIRGTCPVDLVLHANPLFNKTPRIFRNLWKIFREKSYTSRFIPFDKNYNMEAAAQIKKATSLPVIVVGGIRDKESMITALTTYGLDAISLCRPLICDPDWPQKIKAGLSLGSACTNCNVCTIQCDSPQPLQCHQNMKKELR
ncbi:MAG: NADH:flavin oxidoreductase [Kiritimatiellales bacterium]|nr:NADH:flavin oxidoreductase [Kiritimatiellales bacterium]